MRLFLILGLLSSLLARPVLAQTDTILRTNGAEVRARVLTISPRSISYLLATSGSSPAVADTLRVPADSVFLIRYANGTREVLHPQALPSVAPDAAGSALQALSYAQRYQRGQADAQTQYRSPGTFAGTLVTTALLGPLTGLASTAIIGSSRVPDNRLATPMPGLLSDNAYASGYREQANHTKRSRAWSGYGVGVGVDLFLILLLAGMAAH